VFLNVVNANLVELFDRLCGQSRHEPGMIPAQRVFGLDERAEADIIGAVTVDPTRIFLGIRLGQDRLCHKLDFEFHGRFALVEFACQLAVSCHPDRLFGRENFLLFSRGLFDFQFQLPGARFLFR
jgi:hypothetical protein